MAAGARMPGTAEDSATVNAANLAGVVRVLQPLQVVQQLAGLHAALVHVQHRLRVDEGLELAVRLADRRLQLRVEHELAQGQTRMRGGGEILDVQRVRLLVVDQFTICE